ncbi:hypothetical protein [Coprococcus comes]|uniref:hypothetical protein n=1 Tax=Coprococcus comes TaxID=410072 RepID=UPI00319E70F3
MRHRFFPPRSYRRRTLREAGGDTVEYIIVILAVVAIGGGLMGFGNQVSGQVSKTVNGKSKTFLPKAICNGKVSDGIYIRPRIG